MGLWSTVVFRQVNVSCSRFVLDVGCALAAACQPFGTSIFWYRFYYYLFNEMASSALSIFGYFVVTAEVDQHLTNYEGPFIALFSALSKQSFVGGRRACGQLVRFPS